MKNFAFDRELSAVGYDSLDEEIDDEQAARERGKAAIEVCW